MSELRTTPPESLEEALEEADQLLARIRASLIGSIGQTDFGTPSRLPWKLATAKELLLWRTFDLGDASLEALSRENGVPGSLDL